VKTAATVALRAVPRAALALPPAWRRRLAMMLAVLAGLAVLYVGWFRDSSFAKVHDVYVSGLSGPQSRSIRAALEDAGVSMTTLHVRDGALRAAVADYPVVRSVTAQGDFPHTLRIQIELNLPVAVVQTPAGRIPVTADGLLLRDVPLTSGLPLLAGRAGALPDRITDGPTYSLLRVVASAPGPLRDRVRSVQVKAGAGLVAHVRRGPDLIFGNTDRIAAKWVAASRVLASPAARGATYIDLRLPERPAAGGLPTTGVLPLAPAGTSADPPQPPAQQSTGTTTAPTVTTTTPTSTAPTTTAPATTAPTTTATTPTTSAQTTTPATTGGAAEAP
jgi:cell division protein FtsQ